jgi:hypothetical protein
VADALLRVVTTGEENEGVGLPFLTEIVWTVSLVGWAKTWAAAGLASGCCGLLRWTGKPPLHFYFYFIFCFLFCCLNSYLNFGYTCMFLII